MVNWDKNRARGRNRARALVMSATLGLTGLTPLTPLWAQAEPSPPAATPAPTKPPAAPTLPSVTQPPIVTPPVATAPNGTPTAPNPAVPPPVLGGDLAAPPPTITTTPPDTNTAPVPQFTGSITLIKIAGNQNITTPAILAVINQTGLRVGDAYSAGVATAARDAVKSMGYFSGDVVLTGTQDPAGGIDLTFTVRENPLIKTIKFTANTPTGEPTIPSDKLKSLMETKEGRVLNTNVLDRDIVKLFDHQSGYVRSQGYIFDVSSDINFDPTTGVLTLPLVEAHINSIVVKGNKKTKKQVITREFRSHVGDVLNEKQLQRDVTRVYNLGLFDEVGPFDEVSNDVGKVDIIIPVTEKRSGQVSVGVGYSSRSKLVGQATLAENNFRGLGERVSLQWEVGGINSQSSLELGFFEPYLDKRHTSLDVDLYDKAVYRFNSGQFQSSGNTTGDNNTYVERRIGGVLGINRALSDFLTAGITFRTENVKVDNVTLNTADQFIRQKGGVTGLGVRAIYSNRDNEIAPAAGGLRSLSYEIVTSSTRPVDDRFPSELAPGHQNFGKLGLDLRQYTSLQGPRKAGNFNQPKRVLATRLLIGATAKNIPFFEQYFLGGADSLRGYDTDRFWGSSLALFQAELRVPLSNKDNNFQIVGLLDAGDAWNSIYQQQGLRQHANFKLSYDYGLGVRLVTPIGPIRLDYAIPKSGDGSGRTQFSIGQSF